MLPSGRGVRVPSARSGESAGFPPAAERGTCTGMDRLDSDTWCDECGEIGWEGTCEACLQFAAEIDAPTVEAA